MKKLFVVATISLFISLMAISTTQAQTNVLINYQGRVKVQGQLFNGIGQFKFAITNNGGNVSLWSNDETSLTGNEPTASLNISVSEGTFNVLIGDTTQGFEPISSSIFNNSEHLKLRVWFSDGINGFQHLTPDKHILNTDIIGLISDKNDFTIYVDGTNGNDINNGLAPDKAKKTIQAAVDIVPKFIRSNINIKVSPGIYRESVSINGINANEGTLLSLIGDETWDINSVGNPNVRITGTDNDITHTRVRERVLVVRNTVNYKIKGFLIDYGSDMGVYISQSFGWFENSKAQYNGPSGGIGYTGNGVGFLNNCIVSNNDNIGFNLSNFSGPTVTNIKALNNITGLYVSRLASVPLYGTCEFSNNQYGIYVYGGSRLQFSPGYSGTINNNSTYGLFVHEAAFTFNHTLNTFSNNGTGVSDNVQTSNGGATY